MTLLISSAEMRTLSSACAFYQRLMAHNLNEIVLTCNKNNLILPKKNIIIKIQWTFFSRATWNANGAVLKPFMGLFTRLLYTLHIEWCHCWFCTYTQNVCASTSLCSDHFYVICATMTTNYEQHHCEHTFVCWLNWLLALHSVGWLVGISTNTKKTVK